MLNERADFKKPVRPVKKVFLHCSASDNPKHDNVETIERWHKEKGWSGIGYHFYIDKQGRRFVGRDIEKVPAAQQGHNTGSIAICCGGLSEFGAIQLDSLKKLCQQINVAYKGNITFHGHCEVEKSKSCPVFPYKKLLVLDDKGRMKI